MKNRLKIYKNVKIFNSCVQLRKEESDKKMKIAREAQIKQKEHFQAVQAERERQVFERILQSQIEEVSFSFDQNQV